MAEVDHGDEVVEVGVAVGAALDEADSGVEAFDQGVGQLVVDGGDDAVEVVPMRRASATKALIPDRVAAVHQRFRYRAAWAGSTLR